MCVFIRPIVTGKEVTILMETSGCQGQKNHIKYLEHVQITVDLTYSKRGDLQIFVTSPQGIIITMAYVFGGQSVNPFSAGTVFIRRNLTYKDGLCAERIKIFMMALDP